MSNAASTWAEKQVTGSVGAHAVLMRLANYADANGCSFPSVAHLADVTEQSVATVRRKLIDLEERGLIERVSQFRGRQGQVANIFKLLMDRPAAGAPAQKSVSPTEMDTPAQIESPPLSDCDPPPLNDERGPLSNCDGHIEDTSRDTSRDTPPNPPEGGVVRVSSEEKGKGSGEDFETAFAAFIAAYPADPGHSPHEARRPWARLSHGDQAKAMMALPRYLDHAKSRKAPLRSPASYLRSRIWENFAAAPAPVAVATPRELDAVSRAVAWARSDQDRSQWKFVELGTEAWAAWQAAFRYAGYTPPGAAWTFAADDHGEVARRHGRSFPTRFPPRQSGPEPPAEAAAE